eukprot:CAMPEP_0185831054 /NCGR_PEP_ID=MMETSP1353-20130828/1256_1 /TAXON_ID=1077150 /ORGANISM="Erythrolobus australicus, Strain CCMP3124" /LENGTH=565 /DNA_ID=CAMNT_0028529077 /DNA_START=236 /DNA_END=1933 /DNA_ORIENTATION=-
MSESAGSQFVVEPFVGGAQMQSWVWIFALSLLVSFWQGGTMGANDVGNCYGTSVGARVLTVFQACVAATIFITLGAMTIGSEVAKTVGSGIVNYKLFENIPQLFCLGMLMASVATGCWVLFATIFAIPVSTTHSIVGSVVGFGLVEFGASGVDWWPGVGRIAISWIASPVFTGLFAIAFYITAKYWFLRPLQQRGEDYLDRALFWQRCYMTIVVFLVFLTFLLFTTFKFHKEGEWVGINLGISFGTSTTLAALWFFVLHTPINAYFEKRGLRGGFGDDDVAQKQRSARSDSDALSDASSYGIIDEAEYAMIVNGTAAADQVHHRLEASLATSMMRAPSEHGEVLPANDTWHPTLEARFQFGQLLSACYEAIAFGANDLGNAAGTLQAIFQTLELAAVTSKPTPAYWAMAYSTVGILAGLWLLGYRVMATIGRGIATMTPIRGLCAELATAFSVLIASYLGIPVSTTHCSVGGVIGVGLMERKGYKKVNWKLMAVVALSWVVTLPAAGGISAGLYAAARSSTRDQWYVPPADVLQEGEGEYAYTCAGTALVQTCTYTWNTPAVDPS